MIVELYADSSTNNSGEYDRLDTYGNENIALTFQVDDIRDITNKNASYSKNFNLPATKINNDYFNHFYNVDRYNSSNKYNPYINRKCYLQVDGITVLEGYLKLNKTLEKQTEISYKATIFNDVASLIDILGDSTLAELDWDYLNHERSWGNVFASFFGVSVGAIPVDYSYQMINDGGINFSQNYNKYNNYILCIRLKAIIDKIFAFAGFSYQSSLFNTDDFERLYIDTNTKSENVSTNPFLIKYQNANGNLFVQNGGANDPDYAGGKMSPPYAQPQSIPWTDKTGDSDNIANDYGTITLPYSAQIFINCFLSIRNFDFPGYFNASLGYTIGGNVNSYVYKNGEIVYQDSDIFGHGTFNGNATITQTNFSYSLFAEAGDVIEVKFRATTLPDDGLAPQISLGYLNNPPFVYPPNGTDTRLSYYIAPSSPSGIVNSSLGQIKMADILKDVITMFNLNVEQVSSNKILFEPYADFITQDIVDWTDKVDYNEEEVEVIEVPLSLSFKFAEDENDYYNNLYEQANGQRYGDLKLEFNTDSLEEKVIQLSTFAAPVCRTIAYTDLTMQHIATETDDGSLVGFKNKPRLVYRVAQLENIPVDDAPLSSNDLNAVNDAAWNVAPNQFVYNPMTHFSADAPLVNANDFSYLFGIVNVSGMSNLNEQPTNNLFTRYWFPFVNDRFNEDALLIKLLAKLTPADINKLDFSKIYQVENQHYRLNKVNYNTDRNKLSKIELIRI